MSLQSDSLKIKYQEYLAQSGLDLKLADHRPESWPNPFDADDNLDPEGMARLIRFLESTRRYEQWTDVGAEGRNNFLYRLGTVATQRGPYLGEGLQALQGSVDRHTEVLGQALAKSGAVPPFPIYVGLYPTGGFNARVRPANGGALVLVNLGLLDLLHTVLKVNLATSGDEQDPPLLDDTRASMVLADAFNAYLYGDGSVKSWGLPRLDPRREQLLMRVLQPAEAFVIAHELAHVVSGHIALPAQPNQSAVVTLTPATEMEADRVAVDLVVQAAADASTGPRDNSFLAGGMVTVLVIAQALESLRETLGVTGPEDCHHPALRERVPALINILNERMPGSDTLRRAEVFTNWLCVQHLPVVRDWLLAVSEMVKRSSKYDIVPGVL